MDVKPINREGLLSQAGPGKGIDREKLKKTCADFESLFISQLLKGMRRTVPKGGFLEPGQGKDVTEALFDEELGKNLARRDGIGLGKMLYRQILRKEEGIRSPHAARGNGRGGGE